MPENPFVDLTRELVLEKVSPAVLDMVINDVAITWRPYVLFEIFQPQRFTVLEEVELSLVEQDCQRLGHISNGVYCEHCGALVDPTQEDHYG